MQVSTFGESYVTLYITIWLLFGNQLIEEESVGYNSLKLKQLAHNQYFIEFAL